MPFNGIPSKSCQECRIKRRRCDKARPQCAQCIRAKVQCQGYRSDLDLAFRDQTDQIISKTRRVLRSTNKDASAPLPSTIIPSPETSVTRSPSHMFLHDDKAILFFFDHFVMMRPGAIRSDTGFLLDIYRKAEPDDMFNHGVRALGYVLTSAPDEEQFGTVKAYSEYARALRLTSQAVSNVRALTMEKLMATVLLLSMFEATTCTTIPNWEATAKHLDGAARLLQVRGAGIFDDKAGMRLFQHIRAQFISACFYRRKPIPDIIITLTEAAKGHFRTDGERTINSLSELCFEINDLRCQIIDSAIWPHECLQKLIQLDEDLERWADSLPTGLKFTQVPQDRESMGYPGMDYYYEYAQSWVAEIWNTYANMRIRICRHMLGDFIPAPETSEFCERFLTAEQDPDKAESLRIRFEQIEMESRYRICASVPYLLNCRGNAAQQPNLGAYCVTGIFWLLYEAATGLRTPKPLRDWVIDTMRRCERDTGIRLAGTVAEDLERPYHTAPGV